MYAHRWLVVLIPKMLCACSGQDLCYFRRYTCLLSADLGYPQTAAILDHRHFRTSFCGVRGWIEDKHEIQDSKRMIGSCDLRLHRRQSSLREGLGLCLAPRRCLGACEHECRSKQMDHNPCE